MYAHFLNISHFFSHTNYDTHIILLAYIDEHRLLIQVLDLIHRLGIGYQF